MRLQREVDSNTSVTTAFGPLNRALHSIAAHLQRYGSELTSTEETLSDIIRHHDQFLSGAKLEGLRPIADDNLVCNGLNEITSHLRQVKAFLLELETKLKNILALVSIFEHYLASLWSQAKHNGSFSIAYRLPMIEEW